MEVDKDPVSSVDNARLILQGETILAINDGVVGLFMCDGEDLLGRSFLKFSATNQPNGWRSSDLLRLKSTAALAGQRQHFDWTCRIEDGNAFKTRASMRRVKTRGRTYVELTLKSVRESEHQE